MKHIFTYLFISVVFSAFSQAIEDSVVMGPNHANDVFYSLENGEVSQYSGSSWTVAFFNRSQSAAIKINSGHGVELWKVTDDVTQFATITDTTGLSSWDQLYDSDSLWDAESAFESEDLGTQSNYGWGEYNFTSHVIQGSRIFVLKTINNTYYKVFVDKKQAGVFSYRYASLDNSFDTTMVVPVPDYLEKSYAYLNMDNHTLQDREPVDGDWDFEFTKYKIEFPGQGYYPVTGVVSNEGTLVAEVKELPNNADYTGKPFNDAKTVIGSDWKKYDQASSSYTLPDSLCYFVKTEANDIYKLYFTGFEGGSTGKINFEKELISTNVGIRDRANNLTVESIYPNPSTGAAYLVLSANANSKMEVRVFSMLGNIVYQANANANIGLNTFALQLDNVENGVYLVQVSDGVKTNTQKLIISK